MTELPSSEERSWTDGDIPPSWTNCMVRALLRLSGNSTSELVVRRSKDGNLYSEGAERVYGEVLSWRAV